MLSPQPQYLPMTELDHQIFTALIPPDHYLHKAVKVIDFDRFRPLMAPYYHAWLGRPAEEPLLLLKLEFLQYHDRLSDRQVIEQAKVNVAYREFLQLSLRSELPDPSCLSYFRGRLGVKGHREIFDALIQQAREQGLVQDRLRLKDATHVIANVAIPSTIRLVAQMRQRLLNVAAAYDPQRVEGEQARVEVIRSTDSGMTDEQRLEARVTHLREILVWVEALRKQLPIVSGEEDPSRTTLEETLQLAHKILADREDPKAGDHLVSLQDPDARFGFHQGSYCGYLLDILMDADSELITTLNVLPASDDEAKDAAELIRQEEKIHHNDVEAISGDSKLFQGEKLRELTDPEGLDLEVFVPPIQPAQRGYYTPEDFSLDEANAELTCPAGEKTTRRRRNSRETGWIYQFSRRDCEFCPILQYCMPKLPKQQGRAVNKGEYIAEYAAARAKTKTRKYAEVRKTHKKVERKLAEIVRYHDGRRARSRGHPSVLTQELMAATVVNIRRLVQMVCKHERFA